MSWGIGDRVGVAVSAGTIATFNSRRPGPVPSLVLDFAGTGTLDSRVTFTRSTTATYYNSSGVLSTAAINAPRFDYNPSTLAPLGLLIEQSSTNLLTYSQDLSNAAWNKATGCTVNNTANIAPDGTQTANAISQTTNGETNGVFRPGGLFQSGRTVSLYLKAGEITSVIGQNGAGQFWTFNLITGLFSSVNAVFTTSSTSVGNGWWRIQITLGSVAGFDLFIGASSGASAYNKFYIWGAQLEALAFPTSYIPTTSAQVTRASDNASMTGSNFTSWYNQGQGTLYIENTSVNQSGQSYIISNGSNNRYYYSANASSTTSTTSSYDGTNVLANSLITNGVFNKTGSTYSSISNLKTLSANGTAATSGAYNGSWATNTAVKFGEQNFTGWIKKISFYPQALTSAQLQTLTTL
jgi:hypothetical protein